MNNLNKCCYDKTCLGVGWDFNPCQILCLTLPTRLLKEKFCSECGLHSRQAISKEELDGASDEHANIAMANGFTRFYSHHTPRWTVFYKIKNRMFQKINHKHVVEML